MIKTSILKGTQKIIPSKKLDDPREDVTMFILHIRLKAHDADLLFTLNVPNKPASQDSIYETVLQYHDKVFELICGSVEVKDLTILFGG